MKNETAVNELLEYAGPQELAEKLTEFWESWLTNSETDTARAKERADKLYFYKKMMSFINQIEE